MNIDKIIAKLKNEFEKHTKESYPREACGVVVIKKGRYKYFPCRNIAHSNVDFECHPEDVAQAEEAGDLVACFHSHTNGVNRFTPADIAFCNASGLPYILYITTTEQYKWILPELERPDLYGRDYVGGVMDCYTLVQDYFKEKHSITLPEFYRPDRWWEQRLDLLTPKNFEEAGFYQVPKEEIQKDDVVIMQNGSSVADHAAIYIGNQTILHHCYKRLSCSDVYGGMWFKNTRYVLRNKQLCNSPQSNSEAF